MQLPEKLCTKEILTMRLCLLSLPLLVLLFSSGSPVGNSQLAGAEKKPAQQLFVAVPCTDKKLFTTGIEGPACARNGVLYAVNYQKQGTIGRLLRNGTTELFVTLPEGSVGNGIRFDRRGMIYVADYPQHNILRIHPRTRTIEVFAHDDRMNQPNDLAIDGNGVLYASDPNWSNGSGQLWRIDSSGNVTRLATELGTTNGIEVSPDNSTLYVNESLQRNVWAFTIKQDGTLAQKRLIRQFPDHGFDGMRCDQQGNLYITRHGKGTVVKMQPDGEILAEIDVLGTSPTNLCFGGSDGRTVYVTEVEHQRVVKFRADQPGLAWQRWKK
jgi:sugar lactone lactonase YvrE